MRPLNILQDILMCSVCSKAVREDEDTEFGERGKEPNLALGSHVKSKNATSNEDA